MTHRWHCYLLFIFTIGWCGIDRVHVKEIQTHHTPFKPIKDVVPERIVTRLSCIMAYTMYYIVYVVVTLSEPISLSQNIVKPQVKTGNIQIARFVETICYVYTILLLICR